MIPRIFFRTDGNELMGLGHLVRCTALAQMLKDQFKISFFCKAFPEAMEKELSKNNFRLERIQNEQQFVNQLNETVIVVLDGYHFDTQYQRIIKDTGVKLVCVDDLHEKEFVADLIINHAPGVEGSEYNVQPYTMTALGMDYVLLRSNFLKQAKIHRRIEKIEVVMICFGGADPKNLTETALVLVKSFKQIKKIIIVTGHAYENASSIKKLVAGDNKFDYRPELDEENMLNAMLEADLAVVPCSTILFESLAVGCLAISGKYIANQELIYEGLKSKGAFIDAGNFSNDSLSHAFSKVLNGHFHAINLIDGRSPIRISKLFDQLMKESRIGLRKATRADLMPTYKWASNHEIRKFSIQQHPITKTEHTQWFLEKIEDQNCHYFIAEYEKTPIGSIRFDVEEKNARISYLLDPLYHGRSFGQIILKKGINYLFQKKNSKKLPLNKISGIVVKGNVASIKSFERLNFNQSEKQDHFYFEKLV